MNIIKNISSLKNTIPDFIDTKIESHRQVYNIMMSNFVIIESLITPSFIKEKDIHKLSMIYNKNLDRCSELNERISMIYYVYLLNIINQTIETCESEDEYESASNLTKLKQLI